MPPVNATELLDLVGSSDLQRFVCQRSYHVPMLDHDAQELEAAILAFLATRTGPGATSSSVGAP